MTKIDHGELQLYQTNQLLHVRAENLKSCEEKEEELV